MWAAMYVKLCDGVGVIRRVSLRFDLLKRRYIEIGILSFKILKSSSMQWYLYRLVTVN